MNTHSDVIRGHVITQILQGSQRFPNNEKLPLMVYKGAILLHPQDAPEKILNIFADNNWTNGWLDSVYDYDHYHSTTHEVLGVFCGTADIHFGGEEGICVELTRGDVVVIPAGVAHRSLKCSDDFLCAGAYPDGRSYDILCGDEGERPAADNAIAEVPMPSTDPVYGFGGPMKEHWRA